MNKVILMGRLVRDTETRYSDGAELLAVARYTLAVNRRFKKEEADFIPCVAFGKTGEFAEKYFKKRTTGCDCRAVAGAELGQGRRTAVDNGGYR